MISDIQRTIAEQINARELKFAGFSLSASPEEPNRVGIGKGTRYVYITYDAGTDTYTVTRGRVKMNAPEDEEEVLEGIYFDQLQGLIEEHYPRFEYVMDQLNIRFHKARGDE